MSSFAETAPAGARGNSQPTRHAGIAGLGAALPQETIANAAIATRLEVGPEWIERRTGIRNRRRAAPGERVVDLAAQAGRAALADAGLDAAGIDTVLVATMSADELTPNAAPQVAYALGADRAGAMDIGAACTGFVAGLTVGAGLVEAGRAENVLVIGAEVLSRHIDYDDRSTAGLFGDGAGAVVVTANAAGSVGTSVLGSDGSAAEYIRAPHDTGVISMDGHETFKRAVNTLASNALEALDANGLTRDDIELFVFHQANGRITSAVADAIAVDPSRVVDAIGEMGNTSAASIPLALSEAHSQGRLAAGDRVLLGAVGAGFTWGATVVTWGAA
jgi:3-oxoacyl-[acyl-carrier-protein] synthase-3